MTTSRFDEWEEVETVLNNVQSYTALKRLETSDPETPILIAALAGASLSPTLSSLLEDQLTAEGSLRGRAKEKVAVVEEPEEEGPSEYIRPNGKVYHARRWGNRWDVEVLRTARVRDMAPYFFGPPGTGKTALIEAAFGTDLITVVLTGDTEVTDLVGSFVPNPEFGNPGEPEFIWVDGPLLVAAKEGRPLLADEIGLGDPKVLSVLYGLMDGRREINVTANPNIGLVKAADGFFVIGATNPNAPGVRISEALLSRFTLHVEVTTDWDLASKLGVPRSVITVGKNLTVKMKEGLVSWAPQFRELEAFRDVSRVFGTEFAVANLLAICPENDRAVVMDVVSRMMGEKALPAKI